MRLLHVTLLLCAVMALASAKCPKRCPAGWKEYNGRCYKYVATKMTWADAEKHCLSLCGNMVSIRDAGEDKFVHTMKSGLKWIGAHDRVQKGLWLFSDGTKMVYTGWYPGEPNNLGGKQDCMQMFPNGKWDDVGCDYKRASVCVKDL